MWIQEWWEYVVGTGEWRIIIFCHYLSNPMSCHENMSKGSKFRIIVNRKPIKRERER
jgi:hypothetical protein